MLFLEGGKCLVVKGIEFSEEDDDWDCTESPSWSVRNATLSYSPLPVPPVEKNCSSAAVKGLLSSIGIQYLEYKVLVWDGVATIHTI
jgi:hypothetical protein